MLNSNLPEPELLKTILQPLLEDFLYWFERSRQFLEKEEVSFLSTQQQADLLARVKQAQAEVKTTQMLFQATGGQVGVETAALRPWHQLVTECWQVATRFRIEQSAGQQ
jgi:predicted flavoprotein YhiN